VLDAERADERRQMVAAQLRARGISDERVLAAMGLVPRHRFVPEDLLHRAYFDGPLAIGHAATISQPYIVALTCELGQIAPGNRVLDVGTGSGYQAAVLAEMGAEVFGVELIPDLSESAHARLAELGYDVDIVTGDGYVGRPDAAPFDAILVAAAAPAVPEALVEQLRPGGRMVVPLGDPWSPQELTVVTRTPAGFERRPVMSVRFVPLTRDARE
jgi:protein-L-isoaspartate(D-aspartate) O-methyltransferase